MTTIPLAEARANLSRLVDDAMQTHQRIEVTKNGRRAAVLLSADDYDSIMETLDVLSDADEVRAISLAQAEFRDGVYATFEDVEAALRESGRR